jgi:hypothetical protein
VSGSPTSGGVAAHAPPASPLETLTDAIARCVRAGFGDSFQARHGELFALTGGRLLAPEELRVREIVRFEGESDPGDSALLFALSSRDGATRGTFVAGYGASVDAETTAVIERLDARTGARAERL